MTELATKPVVTKDDIVAGLRGLGLRAGDIIGVHSSLSSLGWVEGGAETVVDALVEVVGEAGTVVVPTYSTNRETVPATPEEQALGVTWKSRVLPYDPQSTPCWTGRIPDTLWRRPEAVRSSNPTHSLAAIGPDASVLVEGWEKLWEMDGYILLLGVTLRCCSAMHLAEREVELPEFIVRHITRPPELVAQYPPGEWSLGYGPYPDFLLMEGPCQERGIMTLGRIGSAVVRLVRLRELVDLYAHHLREHPEVFYHGCVETEFLRRHRTRHPALVERIDRLPGPHAENPSAG